MTLNEEVKAIVARLLELFPANNSVHLVARRSNWSDVGLHRFGSYSDATRFMQSLGIGERKKQVHQDNGGWSVLAGKLSPEVEITCYINGLPPSCRKVTKIERVPKSKTVETGEYVEIEREVIECGPEHEPEPATV